MKTCLSEVFRIKLFGTQPIARASDKTLERIINREFQSQTEVVKQKLEKIDSDSHPGKNRLSAAVLKLADGEMNALDHYIILCNADHRDVLALAEYPRCNTIGMVAMNNQNMKSIYLADWLEYQAWINRP
ncbi:MAG: hypothetical protein ACHQRM_04230 [Bacteroidia bacterium]